MEFLEKILTASHMSILSAFVLGLMTAISPCPMATNITAVGYIGKKFDNPKNVFYSGIVYSLGRMSSYFLLALIFYIGSDNLQISAFFQQHSEKFLGPLLFIIGIFMLDLFTIKFPKSFSLTALFEKKNTLNFLDAFIIGFLFALAFCPYSGVLFFGMLVPMTISQPAGMMLPLVFALATSIPVVITAWILSFMISEIGKFYNRMQSIEKWFKRIVAVLFMATGVYYTIPNFMG